MLHQEGVNTGVITPPHAPTPKPQRNNHTEYYKRKDQEGVNIDVITPPPTTPPTPHPPNPERNIQQLTKSARLHAQFSLRWHKQQHETTIFIMTCHHIILPCLRPSIVDPSHPKGRAVGVAEVKRHFQRWLQLRGTKQGTPVDLQQSQGTVLGTVMATMATW